MPPARASQSLHRCLAICLWVLACTSTATGQQEPTNSLRSTPQEPPAGTTPATDAQPPNPDLQAQPLQLPPPLPGPATEAQEPAPGTPEQSLSQQINTRLTQLQASATTMEPEIYESLLKSYQTSLADLAAAATAAASSQKFEQAAASAAEAIRLARQRVADLQQATRPSLLEFEDLDEGKQKLQGLNAELSAASAKLAALREEDVRRTRRQASLPKEISDLQTRADQAAKVAVTAAASENPLVREASQWAATTAQQATTLQIKSLENERRAYEAEAPLLPLQIQVAEQEQLPLQDLVRQANTQIDALKSNRIQKAKYDATQALRETTAKASRTRLETLLSTIEKWEKLAGKQALTLADSESAQDILADWKKRLDTMESGVDVDPGKVRGGQFNTWIGMMLRQQRDELPNPETLQDEIEDIREQLRWAESLRFSVEDDLRGIQLEKNAIQRSALQNATLEQVEDTQPNVAQQWKTLLLCESILNNVKLDSKEFITLQFQAAGTRQDTIDLVRQYDAFIDTHILWIRSCEPLNREDLSDAWDAVLWIASPAQLRSTANLVLADVWTRPWWYLIFVCGMLVLLVNQAAMRRALGKLSQRAIKSSCNDFSLTSRGLMLTFFISTPLALTLLFGYWRLRSAAGLAVNSAADTTHTLALASGLLLAATVLYPMEFLRQVSRKNGLGPMHFGWPEASAQRFAKNLRWLINLAIPLVAIIGLLSAQDDPRRESSLGRFVFIGLMAVLTVLFARLLHPRTGLISSYLNKNHGGWLERTGYVWYPFIVLAPIAIATTSAIGYHYTAQRIANHINTTLWMLVFLTIVYCLLARWLLIGRRKLVIAQARARLEEAARRETNTNAVSDVPDINTIAINEQTKRLVTSAVVTSGLIFTYFIWKDILPAIDILDSVEIFPVKNEVTGEVSSITLANLLLVIPTVMLAVIASRNVPGLLEIALLQHLPLTTAAKYAITTLCRYAIMAVGITLTCWIIGLKWQSIQWLVAALGVGLGFGLQEIFANFVSGIILLFEQPLRVGDVISIDGTTGTVSKIRMRATTIINWDRQELIVPNKDLITGKLLNWTLSDTTNRLLLNVGVAYGSNVEKACAIVYEICEEHDNILTDPQPVVTFDSFGDSSLNLAVRVYLSSLDFRLKTTHELHQRIYEGLGREGIEISFPQRDLHIRSLPEKLTEWLKPKTEPPPV